MNDFIQSAFASQIWEGHADFGNRGRRVLNIKFSVAHQIVDALKASVLKEMFGSPKPMLHFRGHKHRDLFKNLCS